MGSHEEFLTAKEDGMREKEGVKKEYLQLRLTTLIKIN